MHAFSRHHDFGHHILLACKLIHRSRSSDCILSIRDRIERAFFIVLLPIYADRLFVCPCPFAPGKASSPESSCNDVIELQKDHGPWTPSFQLLTCLFTIMRNASN